MKTITMLSQAEARRVSTSPFTELCFLSSDQVLKATVDCFTTETNLCYFYIVDDASGTPMTAEQVRELFEQKDF